MARRGFRPTYFLRLRRVGWSQFQIGRFNTASSGSQRGQATQHCAHLSAVAARHRPPTHLFPSLQKSRLVTTSGRSLQRQHHRAHHVAGQRSTALISRRFAARHRFYDQLVGQGSFALTNLRGAAQHTSIPVALAFTLTSIGHATDRIQTRPYGSTRRVSGRRWSARRILRPTYFLHFGIVSGSHQRVGRSTPTSSGSQGSQATLAPLSSLGSKQGAIVRQSVGGSGFIPSDRPARAPFSYSAGFRYHQHDIRRGRPCWWVYQTNQPSHGQPFRHRHPQSFDRMWVTTVWGSKQYVGHDGDPPTPTVL